MTFVQTLAVEMVRGGLLLVGVLLSGLWVARSVERFKSGQAMRALFAQRRAEALDAIWKALADLVGAWNAFDRADRRTPAEGRSNEELNEGIKAIEAAQAHLMLEQDARRLWLGEDLHGQLAAYVQNARLAMVKSSLTAEQSATLRKLADAAHDKLDALRPQVMLAVEAALKDTNGLRLHVFLVALGIAIGALIGIGVTIAILR